MDNFKIFIASDTLNFLAQEAYTRMAASYFDMQAFSVEKFPNVTTRAKAIEILEQARENKPALVVFSSMVVEVRDAFVMKGLEFNVDCIDILSPMIKTLGRFFGQAPVYLPKHSWQLGDDYYRRINALEFAINNDDGQSLTALQKADVVLVGVSRTSKTPLSIFLAYLNYLVVNVPLVSEANLPSELFEIERSKIIGLTINPRRLNEIRNERNVSMGVESSTSYSEMTGILQELDFSEKVMKKLGCPVIDVTQRAVEETAELITRILKTVKAH